MKAHTPYNIPLAYSLRSGWSDLINWLTAIFCLVFVVAIPRGTPSPSVSLDNTPLARVDSFRTLCVIAAGDNMMHLPQVNAGYNDSSGTYDFSSFYRYVHPMVSQADLAIVNLETTFAGKPYSGYPQFAAPDVLAKNLKECGFNFVINANNHALDRGGEGLVRTLEVLEEHGFHHTGTFTDMESRNANSPVIMTLNGLKIAMLNYTYGTNGLTPPKPGMVNLIDTVLIRADLQKALDSLSDAILVCMHWGNEYEREPDSEQKKLSGFLFRNGADVIIGSHPHVIQPIETCDFIFRGKKKQGLVFWSLGNFISNQRKRYCDGGLMVRFEIRKNRYTDKIEVREVKNIPIWVYRTASSSHYTLVPLGAIESKSLAFDMQASELEQYTQFIIDTREHMKKNSPSIREMGINNP